MRRPLGGNGPGRHLHAARPGALIYLSAKALKRPEVKAFVDFYLENVNAISEEVGFIALTDEQLAESEAATTRLG